MPVSTTAHASTGRYAPSPTGDLHLGNLRTALAAWLFARSGGGRFLLRVDDLDPDRVRPGLAERQLEDLLALELGWDGAPLWQTARLVAYEEALATLVAADLAYPCFCSRAEVLAAASAPHGAAPDGAYPGTCSRLATSDAARRVAAGEAHCLRARADAAVRGIDDGLLGRIEVTVDDFVIRRKDGVPAYNLATTIDDASLGVEHVVRGADLATTAPRQVWLAGALGLSVPAFSHVPLVLGPDGTRLAKRHGAVTLRELLATGDVDAVAVRSMLAHSLGLCGPDERPTIAELLARFDPALVPREPVQLDIARYSRSADL